MRGYNYMAFLKLLTAFKGCDPGEIRASIKFGDDEREDLAAAARCCVESKVNFKVSGTTLVMVGGW